jgi:peroxiredoxin (alkyl hydroperoxide reductase subunit C)
MLGVGQKFPAYEVKATVSTDLKNAFQTLTEKDYPGKWKLYFFWPKDFTFVCPTEIAAFGKMNGDFKDRIVRSWAEARIPNLCTWHGATITPI